MLTGRLGGCLGARLTGGTMTIIIKATRGGEIKSVWTCPANKIKDIKSLQADGYKVQSIETFRAIPKRKGA